MATSGVINWAGVLFLNDRKVLTLKEKDKSFYQLPGGKLDTGETPEQAAIREVEEELSAHVSELKLFLEVDEEAKSVDKTIHFILFTGHFAQMPILDSTPPRTESLAWIDSNYQAQVPDLGNLLKLHVIPELKRKNLID